MANKSGSATEKSAAGGKPARTPGAAGAGACRYCHASIRPADNYCSHCGMPMDPARDQPLFVVESLTNLFNVVFFESLLEQELNRASRYQLDLAVLIAEVDSLPELEGALGYAVTTDLIREVGNTIASVIREPDTLASTNRVTALGTQRFLVLLPQTDEEGAFRAAEKIRGEVEKLAFQMGDGPGQVTLSMGVACTGKDSSAEANLLARATQALIVGRARGRNRVEVAR